MDNLTLLNEFAKRLSYDEKENRFTLEAGLTTEDNKPCVLPKNIDEFKGTFLISKNKLLVKDEYCCFILHKCDASPKKWDDAKKYVEDKGWSLPDRWQGLTISRYKDEIKKFLGQDVTWFWINEEYAYDRTYAWYVTMDFGSVFNVGKTNQDGVLAVSAFQS